MEAGQEVAQEALPGARRFPAAVALAVVVGGACAAWRLTEFGGERVTVAAVDAFSVLTALAAAVACLRSSRSRCDSSRAWTMSMRRAWRLVGLAVLAMGAGDAIWMWYDVVLRRDVPCPSLADVAYLGSVPLMAAGVLSFPVAPARRAARLRTLMDGVLIAGCLLSISWVTVLRPLYRQSHVPLVERVVELAYPLGDVTIATIALILLARTRGRALGPLWLVAAAMVVFAVSDTLYLYLDQTNRYGNGNLIDVGWPVAYLLLALAPLRPLRARARREGQDQVSLAQLIPPYGVLAVTVTVCLVKGLDPLLFFTSIAIGGLVLLRGVASIVENRRLNQRLGRMVGELTERENQLAQALSRGKSAAEGLQAADAMKDTFLRAVSHDLRNPLAAILGVALTLERTRFQLPRPKSIELLEMLVEKARKLDRLLNDLLDLNRLEQGMLEPDRSPTDVRALLVRVVDEVDHLGGWPVEVEASAVTAAIDASKVERIVENLLVNATKHTPPGTPVWVRGLARGRDLELVVADAGPGVPPELAGSVFEPFGQGGPDDSHGIGIGLSLVTRFAQLHGGQAWVSERTGGGASFHVMLPDAVLLPGALGVPAPRDAPAHADPLPAGDRSPVAR
jgi:signal transduction histidine kinase